MPPSHSFLIVADDVNLRDSLSMTLERRGATVASAANARHARELLQARPYDLAVLGLRLPDADGMSLLAEIRQQYPDTAVLILPAHATVDTAIEAIRQGACGYLAQPACPDRVLELAEEALAQQKPRQRGRDIAVQVWSLLTEWISIESSAAVPGASARVLPPAEMARLMHCGPIVLDLYTRLATVNNQRLNLTSTRFNYLVTLVRHVPVAVPYRTLVSEAQGHHVSEAEARQVSHFHIFVLRKTLETAPQPSPIIQTVRGVGYRLVA